MKTAEVKIGAKMRNQVEKRKSNYKELITDLWQT